MCCVRGLGSVERKWRDRVPGVRERGREWEEEVRKGVGEEVREREWKEEMRMAVRGRGKRRGV